jgi:hypothetical protein
MSCKGGRRKGLGRWDIAGVILDIGRSRWVCVMGYWILDIGDIDIDIGRSRFDCMRCNCRISILDSDWIASLISMSNQ